MVYKATVRRFCVFGSLFIAPKQVLIHLLSNRHPTRGRHGHHPHILRTTFPCSGANTPRSVGGSQQDAGLSAAVERLKGTVNNVPIPPKHSLGVAVHPQYLSAL